VRSAGGLRIFAPAHRQVGIAIQPIHSFLIDTREVQAQQVMNAPVAEASAACAISTILVFSASVSALTSRACR